MVVSKKILSLLLAVLLCFSCFGVSSYATEQSAAAAQESTFFEGVESFFAEIINLIKSAFDKVYNLICALFGIGYTNVDIKSVTENSFAVPGLDTDFVPQGMCYIDLLEKFAISGYMSGKTGQSRIYLADPETNEYKYILLDGFYAHAGGIASNGNDIWVSSGGGLDKDSGAYNYGTVYHITVDALAQAENGSELSFDGSFKTEAKGSFAYADDEMLWVGEFYTPGGDNEVNPAHYSGNNHSIVCGYTLPLDVDYSMNSPLVPDIVLSITDKVQGMAADVHGNIYFSTSYGRHNNSALYIFDNYSSWNKSSIAVMDSSVDFYTPNNSSQLAKIKMPTLMEAVDYENGQLYILFESGAKAYSDADEIITDVWKTNTELLLNMLG